MNLYVMFISIAKSNIKERIRSGEVKDERHRLTD